MRPNIRLGRIFGIEVGLHYSWFLIALLIVMSLVGQFTANHPEWGQGVIWAVSIVTAILFFAALLAHEMSHALMARSHGLATRSITLFALGGVASIETEPKDPKTEFWVGIIGPIASAVIGAVSLALAWLGGWQPGATPETPGSAMLVWLGYINLMLAVFNLVPGFPLDGGRILRSIIWGAIKDGVKATRIAARVGQAVALCFIAIGILRFFGGEGFGGLWIAFIGWFLLTAASASMVQTQLTADLSGVRVSDIMTRDCAVVDGRSNLQTFVDEYLLRSGQRCFIVQRDNEIVGLITPHEIKAVERQRWPYITVLDVMRPIDDIHMVTPATPVVDALETMGRDDVNQLPVVSDHHLQGVISRGNIVQFLQNRAELTR